MATFDLEIHQKETVLEPEVMCIATLYNELQRQIYPIDMAQNELNKAGQMTTPASLSWWVKVGRYYNYTP